MIRTRMIKGKLAFYESTTGVVLTSIKSVSFTSKPGVISSVISKGEELYVYYPDYHGDVQCVKLYDLINLSGESVERVS